jgi:Ser/Thr protein kinase RdoA (MazF antagonist)
MIRVAGSILDADALAADVLAAHDIEVRSCRFYSFGVNDTYQVDAGHGRFYLRVYRYAWRTRAEVDGELHAIEQAHAAGASVARPVARRDGTFVAELDAPEGTRFAVLFHEAPGRPIGYDTKAGVENAARYGRAVAALHNATAGCRPAGGRAPIDVSTAIDRPLATVLSRLRGDDEAYVAQLGAALRARIAGTNGLSEGFCHGDLNGENVHFDDDCATFFDFDFCGWGWRGFEIATFPRGVTLYRRPGRTADRLIRAFLEAYCRDRPLSGADLASIPAFLLIQRIWMAAVHLNAARVWGLRWFGPEYVRRLAEWLRQWAAVVDSPPCWLPA